MRIVLQRVTSASVRVGAETVGSIGRGYVVFIGIERGDTEEQAAWLAKKIANMRLFDGTDGRVNDRNVIDCAGAVLVISQFTLFGDVEHGNRPDFTSAADPMLARALYHFFRERLRAAGVRDVQSGRFGASMIVESVADGPVTLLLHR